MFRHGSRFLARATTMTWRRPFATDLQAGYVADSNFTEAWKKVVPNVDPPKTPSAFMAPRPATPSSIPSKLTVNFVLPYTSELSGKEVFAMSELYESLRNDEEKEYYTPSRFNGFVVQEVMQKNLLLKQERVGKRFNAIFIALRSTAPKKIEAVEF
ncbi:hypothetical protein KY285_024314 [Solanum tuberosum]|nr:hypothetical protein KY285_024314 [Solanum tuberosum]